MAFISGSILVVGVWGGRVGPFESMTTCAGYEVVQADTHTHTHTCPGQYRNRSGVVADQRGTECLAPLNLLLSLQLVGGRCFVGHLSAQIGLWLAGPSCRLGGHAYVRALGTTRGGCMGGGALSPPPPSPTAPVRSDLPALGTPSRIAYHNSSRPKLGLLRPVSFLREEDVFSRGGGGFAVYLEHRYGT